MGDARVILSYIPAITAPNIACILHQNCTWVPCASVSYCSNAMHIHNFNKNIWFLLSVILHIHSSYIIIQECMIKWGHLSCALALV